MSTAEIHVSVNQIFAAPYTTTLLKEGGELPQSDQLKTGGITERKCSKTL